MNLYQITLPAFAKLSDASPHVDEWRKTMLEKAVEWRKTVLEKAGGYTQLNAAQGAWIDETHDTRRHPISDILTVYQIACEPAAWRAIVAKAFECFPNEKAIFWAQIGDATVEFRPDPTELVITEMDRMHEGCRGTWCPDPKCDLVDVCDRCGEVRA
jgi:hypothetical protein